MTLLEGFSYLERAILQGEASVKKKLTL